ncbi:MAG: chloride channel protein [Sedimentisphaerales bacterium]|nr:chloride channel protein [Sedimentisphaerales bacterium]
MSVTSSSSSSRRRGRFKHNIKRLLGRLGFRTDSYLVLLACLIGALTGLGSVGFSKLIEWSHGLSYGGEHGAGVYQGQWYWLVVLPSLGALLVGIITFYFAREAKGHGVPEVMDAIARRHGVIRPRVALAKAVASALTIGSGGSAGTEGPIIQIGAALGSVTGKLFAAAKYNMPVLVGCGAAAGISAIFHAPIAGVLFALEIFLREMNIRTFAPVLLSSVLSSVVVRAILGAHEAIFPLVGAGTSYTFVWYELGNYIVLGFLCAAAAVLFIRVLYAFEDFFDKLKVHHIAKPVLGAIGLGILGVLTVKALEGGVSPEPSIFGNGYRTIGQCIGAIQGRAEGGVELGIGILVLLFCLKTLATSLTLGSGGSGGIFAPSLFLGATAGYAFGLTMQHIRFFAGVNPQTYSLVGMAAVVAATTHAPLTAIVILFEMTRNYHVILPVMFAATIAVGAARLMHHESIYTLKLHRRGVRYESLSRMSVLRRLEVRQVMTPLCTVVGNDMPLAQVLERAHETASTDLIVTDHNGCYYGMLVAADLLEALHEPAALPLLVAGELARRNVAAVGPQETLDKVFNTFSVFDDVDSLAVQAPDDPRRFVGLVTRAALMRRYHEELHRNE